MCLYSVDRVRSYYKCRGKTLSNLRLQSYSPCSRMQAEKRAYSSVKLAEVIRTVERIAKERLSLPISGLLHKSRIGDTYIHLEFERLGQANKSIGKLTEIARDLELELKRSPITITLSGSISIDIPLPSEDRHILTIEELYQELGDYHDGWRIPIGRYSDGSLALFDLSSGSHTLVAGTTGSGKTEFLKSIVSTISHSYSPIDLELILADRKGQLREFCSVPNLVQPITHTDYDFRQLLGWISKELEGREILGADLKDAGIPKLVIVIDEIQGFEARVGLADLLARGRSSDVVFIVSTQNPHHSILPSTLTCNLDTRVCFKTATSSQGFLIISTSETANLVGSGDGLFRLGGETKRFQSALVESSNDISSSAN